jgi:hypothetical protein
VTLIGWIDHFEYYGPLKDPKLLEEPKYLTSAVVLTQSDEAFEYAVKGWSRFGTLELVEAIYAYVQQVKRSLLDRRGLLQRLIALLPRAEVGDLLAMQRVLKLGIGVTTCDLGLVVLSYVVVRDGAPPQPPPGLLYELRRTDATVYITRNNKGNAIYDGETMCVVPASGRPPRHPLYEAYLRGFRVVTEGLPKETDLCVMHKKLKIRCLDVASSGAW